MSINFAAVPTPKAARRGLRLPASPPFVCIADPGAFDVYLDDAGKAHLLPMLRRVYLAAGVGNVELKSYPDPADGTKRSYADGSKAVAEHEQRGGVKVPFGWPMLVFGERVTPPEGTIGYCAAIAVQDGGVCHRLPWERPVLSGVRIRWAWDWAGYLQWMGRIRDELTGEPTAELREGLRYGMLRRWRAAGSGSSVARGNAQLLEAKLRGMGWLEGSAVAVGSPTPGRFPVATVSAMPEVPDLTEDEPPAQAAPAAAPAAVPAPAAPAAAEPAPAAPPPARAVKAGDRRPRAAKPPPMAVEVPTEDQDPDGSDLEADDALPAPRTS